MARQTIEVRACPGGGASQVKFLAGKEERRAYDEREEWYVTDSERAFGGL